jgi:hypothetical protein
VSSPVDAPTTPPDDLPSVDRRRWSSRRSLSLGVAVAVATAGLVTVHVVRSRPIEAKHRSDTEAEKWRSATLDDFNILGPVIIDFVRVLNQWQQGQGTPAGLARAADAALPSFVATAEMLERRSPLPSAPRAIQDYRDAVALYVITAQLAKIDATLPAGPLRDQVRLSYARTRNLGDRLFDQASVELHVDPTAPADTAGIDTQKPAEVPLWSSLGLAAGPPLDVPSSPQPIREYLASRPQVPFEQWADDVQLAQVPQSHVVANAIDSASHEALSSLSRQFQQASDALVADADPRGERVVSTRVELGLLVDAEALYVAGAASLLPAPQAAQLRGVARNLLTMGDSLWDPRLGVRHSTATTPTP